MFPNNLDSSRFPLRTRLSGILVGSCVMIAAGAALVTPATLEVTMPLCLAVIVATAWWNGAVSSLVPGISAGSIVSGAFFGLAMLSALWASHPQDSAFWVFQSFAAFVGCGLASRYFLSESRRNIFHVSEGLWIGILAGLIYLAVEILTHQAIKLNLYTALGLGPNDLRPPHHFNWLNGKLVSIDAADLTRNIAPIPVYIWAAILAVRGTTTASLMRPLMLGMFVLAAIVVTISENETAKLALAAGAFIYAVSRLAPNFSLRLLQVSWLSVCLAIVPLSLALYRLNLHNASWVQPTLQHRIIIWNRVSEETMKSPLRGIGAGMTYWNYDDAKARRDGEMYSRFSRDAHSVFLQTWFELGVIGAALLALIGFAVLERIRSLAGSIAPFGYATFTSTAVTLASSFGMWRAWFMYIFAFTVTMFAIAIRAAIRSEKTPGLANTQK